MSGLLHHSGTGKANHAFRLGDDDVTQGGKAGGNSTGGGVSEDRDVRTPGLGVSGQRSAGLGHLHETENALVHSSPARCGKDNDGLPLGGGQFNGAGDFLPHDAAHAGAEESEVHDGENHGNAFDARPSCNHRFHEAGLGLVGFHFIQIAFESEGIDRVENAINLGKASFINDGGDAVVGVKGEVVSALGADAKVADECFFKKRLATGGSLDPKPLGHVFLFFAQIGDGPFLENSHDGC